MTTKKEEKIKEFKHFETENVTSTIIPAGTMDDEIISWEDVDTETIEINDPRLKDSFKIHLHGWNKITRKDTGEVSLYWKSRWEDRALKFFIMDDCKEIRDMIEKIVRKTESEAPGLVQNIGIQTKEEAILTVLAQEQGTQKLKPGMHPDHKKYFRKR